MRTLFLTVLVASAVVLSVPVTATAAKKPSRDRAPTYEEIRAGQALGRALASPDGRFFLYEWSRPYNWVRDTRGLPAKAADRQQTWLYKVDVDLLPTTSQYLFHPGSGSTYWLGDLSPDSNKVSFYQLDNDDNSVKAGVWDIAESKLTWLTVTPDAARLDQRAVWLSNDELVYPGKLAGKSNVPQLVKASAVTGEAKPCPDCASFVAAASAAPQIETPAPPTLGPDTQLLAQSKTGELAIYARNTADLLSLTFKKGSNDPEIVFENARK